MSGVEDVQDQHRQFKRPHNAHHPIPTIEGYREEKQKREAIRSQAPDESEELSKRDRISDAYNAFKYGKDATDSPEADGPYKSTNKNLLQDEKMAEDHAGDSTSMKKNQPLPQDQNAQQGIEDTTEHHLQKPSGPKKARKEMKKYNPDGTAREVTDPITHLPVQIHDFTKKDLQNTPKNSPPAGQEQNVKTGLAAVDKSENQFIDEEQESRDAHKAMEMLFPPPSFDDARSEITNVYTRAVTAGLSAVALSLMAVNTMFWVARHTEGWMRHVWKAAELATMLFVSSAIILFTRQWSTNKIKNVWDVEVWRAERCQGQKLAKSQSAESVQWLNSLVASIWPLINPDLFASISDTLEDVMQASLPSMVRMVAVEDLGQGSEALRILGIRWLPTGAAARSVSSDGKLKSADEEKEDRTVRDDGKGQTSAPEHDTMEAEEGDFVNVEIAFAYKPSTGRGFQSRAKNAHLYLAFYLPGNIKLPVWVELTGLVGVMRLRLQLCPDPPFFSVCTMSFLGQPNATLSCVPLIKRGPNLMDVPLISNFVQSSMDAALAEYVAPKSLTLDLKDMMMGDDFKKDTIAQGILMVRIKYAFDFKEGDAGFGPFTQGSADPYVTVGWAKFGKPVWSTRVLLGNMEPYWDETCFICVTPDELNADERLRVQLWDSDRATADDDLGRIELELKQLMKSDETNGRMHDREDGFKALKAGEGMPGKLSWSVGYFSKTRITDDQLAAQEEEPDIKSMDQLKAKVFAEAQNKLREANMDHRAEIEQQKVEELKHRQDQLIIASPPSEDYPSGILSIQIHQITGLELEVLNKNQAAANAETADETEKSNELPSAYCTIILNHRKVFQTRTKPKNSKPFYNAGCERFVQDIRNAEVHIDVRDARVHEDDPLLGIIYLPLEKLFHKRSQINSTFPLAGGVGYGRAQISMVFRSVQLQMPRNMLGWDYGTLDIKPNVRAIDVPADLQTLRMKIRVKSSRGKLHSNCKNRGVGQEAHDTMWKTRKERPLRLPVRMRYATSMVVEFRQDAALKNRTPAFGILWLKDVADNEEKTIRMAIWRGDLGRAQNNVLDSYGDKIGEIEVTLTFWSGLSGYHEEFAKKDRNLRQVMDVLDACNDLDGSEWEDGGGKVGIENNKEHDTERSSSSSDSEEDSDDESSIFVPDFLRKDNKRDSKLDEDGKRGVIDQVKEYRASAKQLHRRNRGLMQWKGPRTLAWMKHVGDNGKAKVGSLLKHHERNGAGVETET